ncbi:Polysaccharide deacetylase [Belliella buryatensis]|uniref:Polysaccharide deacetylase n=1 Tax=Belliella buryatensis TaxID=1500549 RepID=A0A239CS17_9BACT|nr:polysaccharide deacetylase family protein [Belliella buryatensis]SNS22920.1 Polysaccharide deacetylase [Belliella buryatensis]
MSKPTFIISLDFELHWGRFDKYKLQDFQKYYLNTIKYVVPRLLERFDHYNIRASWATVGMLLAENEEEWTQFAPTIKPNYDNPKFSPYTWNQANNYKTLHGLFAPDLVRQIVNLKSQELASHTFSHYYSCEKGQSSKAFKADLQAARNIAKEKFGVLPKSLVFPRNQYNQNALDIAQAVGFETYRSNPNDWFWQNTQEETMLKKMFRTGDTLVALSDNFLFDLPDKNSDLILPIPASRLLRPFRKVSFLHEIRIEKIKKELSIAANKNKAYHLWWHPHNFGHYPEENLHYFEMILLHYQRLNESHGMQSISMADCKTPMIH